MGVIRGHLFKMKTASGDPVQYQLRLDELLVPMNGYLGREVSLRHTGDIHCVGCGRALKKTYQQGYCFPCTQSLAECDLCIVRPELCHFHKGTCRQPDWGETHCMRPHVVYLANSSGLKVGITRHTQVPTRWIDQGAIQATPLLRVRTRFQAGLCEVMVKNHAADKTNWRQMLKGEVDLIDLKGARSRILAACGDGLKRLRERFGADAIEVVPEEDPYKFQYPVLEYPVKITSLNLDKTPEITGTLVGIKGQYLIFDRGVINIRKYQGYQVDWLAPA